MADTILNAVSATGPGEWFDPTRVPFSVQFTLSDTTTPSATAYVQITNDGNEPVKYANTDVVLSGAKATDIIKVSTPCEKFRAYVDDISGTSATITATASYEQVKL